MGKKRGGKNFPNLESGSHAPISLREEATGKLQTKPASNTRSKLRFEHLKKLAVWATIDPLIPSLGAFYGQHFVTLAEATGVPPDPSLITCQRCEIVLHPGFNSTVRIEKNRSTVRHRHKKSGNITQNNVVYKCHFCLHQNLKRGTPKGHIKGIWPLKDKSLSESTPPTKPIAHESAKLEEGILSKDVASEIDVFPSQVVAKDIALIDGLATPPSTSATMLEGKKRRRNSSTFMKSVETASMPTKVEVAKTLSTVSKSRRKSWTSLKEIAQNNEHENSQVTNLTIPFFL
ncbi:RNAse P, Rpr2/Rpp21 subunit [Sesbania bispinosa]|nr:RNAse P, Rpr2/Rpp21 subunit [Sesbania bispinosa]